jgi:hypothetical protein
MTTTLAKGVVKRDAKEWVFRTYLRSHDVGSENRRFRLDWIYDFHITSGENETHVRVDDYRHIFY